MHEPSLSHRRRRFGWRVGTLRPSRRHKRSTRFGLAAIESTVALAPTVKRLLCNAKFATNLGDFHSSSHLDLSLPKFHDDLLG
jgi:hypothetical protein